MGASNHFLKLRNEHNWINPSQHSFLLAVTKQSCWQPTQASNKKRLSPIASNLEHRMKQSQEHCIEERNVLAKRTISSPRTVNRVTKYHQYHTFHSTFRSSCSSLSAKRGNGTNEDDTQEPTKNDVLYSELHNQEWYRTREILQTKVWIPPIFRTRNHSHPNTSYHNKNKGPASAQWVKTTLATKQMASNSNQCHYDREPNG